MTSHAERLIQPSTCEFGPILSKCFSNRILVNLRQSWPGKSVGNSSNWWIFPAKTWGSCVSAVELKRSWGPWGPGCGWDVVRKVANFRRFRALAGWLVSSGLERGVQQDKLPATGVFGPSTVTQSIGNGLLGKPFMYMHHLSYLSSSFIYRVKYVIWPQIPSNTNHGCYIITYQLACQIPGQHPAPRFASDCGDAVAVAEVQALCGCRLGSQGRLKMGDQGTGYVCWLIRFNKPYSHH